MPETRIIVGDARTALAELPAGSVQCAVTSPPYFGLRDYGAAGQIGLEASVDEYVAQLVAVFREVRRVLRDDGTAFLNVGDSYASPNQGNKNGCGASGLKRDGRPEAARCKANAAMGADMRRMAFERKVPPGLKTKDLLMVPARVALALQADGWWVRSEIVWHKPNPMPESVRDRPTSAHEKVFLLAKSTSYFWDADAVAEPCGVDAGRPQTKRALELAKAADLSEAHLSALLSAGVSDTGKSRTVRRRWGETSEEVQTLADEARAALKGYAREFAQGTTRNARNVQTWTPKPYRGAHFAVMPLDMAEWCIKAGTSERGQCPHCGSPWGRVVERTAAAPARFGEWKSTGETHRNDIDRKGGFYDALRVEKGWSPSCSCPAHEPAPQMVLDPFAGAGTTLLAANCLGRNTVGVELNPQYAELARARIAEAAAPKPAKPRRVSVSNPAPSLFDGLVAAE